MYNMMSNTNKYWSLSFLGFCRIMLSDSLPAVEGDPPWNIYTFELSEDTVSSILSIEFPIKHVNLYVTKIVCKCMS